MGAQAKDAAAGDVAEITGMAKLLPREHVAQVNFDERDVHGQQGIAHGDAGVCIGARVQDDERGAVFACGLYSINNFVLGVTLEARQRMAEIIGHVGQAIFDRRQALITVNTRLPGAEQIQVWPVDQ